MQRPDPSGQSVGLRPVFALMARWGAVLGGGVTLVAAIAFFLQPYTRSTGALVAASVGTLAAAALLLFGAAWVYQHPHNVQIRMPLWMVIGAVVLFVGAGASLWGAFGARSAPRSGAGRVSVQTALGSASDSSASASCPAGSVIASAQAALASAQPTTRLAAVSTLRRAMATSPGEQCAAINVLTAFIRKESPVSADDDSPVTQAVQSALTALAGRNAAHDGGAVIDLRDTDLTSADLAGANLAGADLSGDNGADLTDADLAGANLSGANLENAYLGDANIAGVDFTGADLTDASFYGTPLCSASNVPLHPAEDYNCTE